jgi:hypothetical protein
MGHGIPSKMVKKFRYATTIRLDAALAGSAYHLFRANGTYDPDMTGIGHQPLGYDEIAALYNQAMVLKSKITCDFLPNGSSSTGHAVVGIDIVPTTGQVVTNFDSIREQRRAHYSVAPSNVLKTRVTHGYNKNVAYPAAKDDLTFAVADGNPGEEAYYLVFQTGTNNSLNPDNVDVVVTIDYTVMLFDPIPFGQS